MSNELYVLHILDISHCHVNHPPGPLHGDAAGPGPDTRVSLGGAQVEARGQTRPRPTGDTHTR